MSIKLRDHEITNLPLDDFFHIIENGKKIVFTQLDDVKIYMLQNNLTEEFLEEHYYGEIEDDTTLSEDDYWYLRRWIIFRDVYVTGEARDKLIKQMDDDIKKSLERFKSNDK